MDKDSQRVIAAFVLTYPMSFAYLFLARTWLTNSTARALVIGCGGLVIGFSVYGWSCMVHCALAYMYSYTLLRRYCESQPDAQKCRRSMRYPLTICALSMLHLSYINVHRMYFNPKNSVDLSAPFMILVIKLTSCAWNAYDGKFIDGGAMTVPTPSEYFGYVMFFPAFLGGPALEYSAYRDHLHGSMAFGVRDTWWPALKRLSIGFACAAVHFQLGAWFPLSYYETTEFQ